LLALRRWPVEHPTPARLTWIHTVLTHAAARGFDRLPLPIAAADGVSFVSFDDHLWDLTPWLAGVADYREHPSPGRLTAALQALARLHVALADFEPNPLPFGPAPGLTARLGQLRRLMSGDAATLRTAIRRSPAGPASGAPAGLPSSAILHSAQEILAHFERRAANVERLLAAAATRSVPLQPAIRDIHHEHVLFVGDSATGVIDFGAMRFDSVAGDVARLLGSLVGNEQLCWQAGLAAYEAWRPLSAVERNLVDVFDGSGVLLGAMNWLDWLFVQRRQFADLARVQARLEELLARLRSSE
jgi:Ser/Thr protein kinase RdoA (MazF antagonist)